MSGCKGRVMTMMVAFAVVSTAAAPEQTAAPAVVDFPCLEDGTGRHHIVAVDRSLAC